MALVTKLETKNGLSFNAAVLVICSLVDARNEQYTYQVSQPGPAAAGGAVQYRGIENASPNRTSQYQVWIFASEQHLRDGQPPVANLINDQTHAPNHPFTLDDKSALTQIEQAYQHLMERYPDATELDLSELGLK